MKMPLNHLHAAGKGSLRVPYDVNKYANNFDNIFNKETKKMDSVKIEIEVEFHHEPNEPANGLKDVFYIEGLHIGGYSLSNKELNNIEPMNRILFDYLTDNA